MRTNSSASEWLREPLPKTTPYDSLLIGFWELRSFEILEAALKARAARSLALEQLHEICWLAVVASG